MPTAHPTMLRHFQAHFTNSFQPLSQPVFIVLRQNMQLYSLIHIRFRVTTFHDTVAHCTQSHSTRYYVNFSLKSITHFLSVHSQTVFLSHSQFNFQWKTVSLRNITIRLLRCECEKEKNTNQFGKQT